MKKILTKAAITSILILLPGLTCYASGPATTGANFLKIGVGARATAMGGAFTAISDDGTALYWNPAGLAQIERTELSTMYNMHFVEIKQGYLSLAFPLLGGMTGVGVNYVDMGTMEGRDVEGNPTGEFGASDIQASLAYANKVSPKLMLGISAGMLQDTIADDKITAYSGNVGLLFKATESTSVSLVCQNIGSKLGEDPLPLTYRGGVAVRLKSINIEADVVKAIDDDMYYCAGLEWWIGNVLALRAGYRTGQDTGSGISYGAGFKIGKISLDYAHVPYGDLGNIQRISLGIKF